MPTTLQRVDLYADVGLDFSAILTWRDSAGALVNVTGYGVKAQVRKAKDPASAVLFEWPLTGAVVNGGAAGTIELKATPAQTAAWSAFYRPSFWDIILTSPTAVKTRLAGGYFYAQVGVTV